jgi:hypothetical protein
MRASSMLRLKLVKRWGSKATGMTRTFLAPFTVVVVNSRFALALQKSEAERDHDPAFSSVAAFQC